MANQSITGFYPIARAGHAVASRWVPVLDADVASIGIFTGDLVAPTSAGSWVASTAGGGAASIGSVCLGVRYYSSTVGALVDRKYIPVGTTGGTTIGAYNTMWINIVENVPDCMFVAQLNGALTMTGQGLNYNWVAGVGSTATGVSGHYITTSGATSTATATPLRMIGPVLAPDNDFTAASCKVLVEFAVGTSPLYTGGETGV